MTHPVTNLDRGTWAETNPSKCPCHGFGWILSDYDTWHRCPLHSACVPHPEDETEETFDFAAHLLQVQRVAFEKYRNLAHMAGWRSSHLTFTKSCRRALLAAGVKAPTAAQWVDEAEAQAEDLARMRAEMDAQSRGFTCDLEARLADEAVWERREA